MISVSDGIKLAQFVIAGAHRVLGDLETEPARLQIAIEQHMKFISNWSEHTELGLNEYSPISISQSTIALQFEYGLSKFRITDDSDINNIKTFGEISLLEQPRSIMIAGQPGAGKTTTVRRLIRSLLHPHSLDAKIEDLKYSVPVLIRCRALQVPSLVETIARTLGLPIEKNVFEDEKGKQNTRLEILGVDAWQTVARILDELQAVLFVDGVDEAPIEDQEAILSELSQLSFSLTAAKIVATCRNGSLTRPLDGFLMVEICPITEDQAIEIAKNCIKDWEGFAKEINRISYKNLIDRPLFLLLALVIYLDVGALPNRGMYLHERVLNLCLEGWDSRRGVRRISKYSLFLTEEKKQFLSELAAFLLCRKKPIRLFSKKQIQEFYKKSCNRFDLPLSEMDVVISELESHTGIIVESSIGNYEFSHLSIQEYLSALYLIRQPSPRRIFDNYQRLPELVALVVALASVPEDYLVDFLQLVSGKRRKGLKGIWRPNAYFNERNASMFLTRLCFERPNFNLSVVTGIVFIVLMTHRNWQSIMSKILIKNISELPNVRESVRSVLAAYGGRVDGISRITFNHNSEWRDFVPDDLFQPLATLVDECGKKFPPSFASTFLGDELVGEIGDGENR